MPTEKELTLIQRLHWCVEDMRTGTQRNTPVELEAIIRDIVREEMDRVLGPPVWVNEPRDHVHPQMEDRISALENHHCSCEGVQK